MIFVDSRSNILIFNLFLCVLKILQIFNFTIYKEYINHQIKFLNKLKISKIYLLLAKEKIF